MSPLAPVSPVIVITVAPASFSSEFLIEGKPLESTVITPAMLPSESTTCSAATPSVPKTGVTEYVAPS